MGDRSEIETSRRDGLPVAGLLLGAALLALLLRVLVFRDGGEPGAYVSVVAFWVCLVGAVVVGLRRSVFGRSGSGLDAVAAAWIVGAIAAAAFAVGGFSDNGSVETVSRIVLLVGLLALVALMVRITQARAHK
jgi:hypothetical membrane protein